MGAVPKKLGLKGLLFYVFPFFVMFFNSCGLETFYKIEPPFDAVPQHAADGVTVPNPPTVSTETRKFEFSSKNNSGFVAPGTEIYYRIYSSAEKLQQDAKAVNAVNTDVGGNGFYKLQSLNYKRLRVQAGGKNQDLLIDGAHRIVVRLADDGIFTVGVFYDGTPSPAFSPVLRDGDLKFYFGKEDANSLKNPHVGDADFDSSGVESGYWFVNAYAVSTGLLSSTWTRTVSKLLPLGFLAFKKET